MLGIMRKYKESIVIKIVFVVIVLSFVGTIFLVWGTGDEGMGGGTAYAAKVNGQKISIEDFQKSYYRLRSIYDQIYGQSMSPEMEKQLGIKKVALDNLIDTALIRKEAKKMGLSVSKDEVAAAVAAVPAFQTNGAFDFQQYQQVLRSNRMTPAEFEDAQREELLVKKAREKVRDQVKVTDEEALQAYKKQNDKVELQYVSFAPADVAKEVTVTEQDLNSYLQSHQEQFKIPEQMVLQYAVLDPAKVAATMTLTDEEMQTWYQKNIDRYQGKEGILPLTEVKDRVRVDALRNKGAKQAYEMAADAINKHLSTADIASAAKSVGAAVVETSWFTPSNPPAQLAGEAEVAKRAFLLKQGELGGPVETSRGIYILKAKEKKPAAVPPLAQVKDRVEKLVREEKARDLARKKAEEALAQLSKGASGANARDTGIFSYSDKSPVVPNIGPSPEVMEAAFALTTAAPAAKTPFKVGDRWFAIKLKNRVAADVSGFQKSKEQVVQSLLPKKQQEAMDAWLKDLKAKAKIEINEALLAE